MANLYVLIPIFCVVLFSSSVYSDVYKQVNKDGTVTYSNAETKGAKKIEPDTDLLVKKWQENNRLYIENFRANLKIGDYTTQGMVVEIKRPIVKLQTSDGERWFNLHSIYPANLHDLK